MSNHYMDSKSLKQFASMIKTCRTYLTREELMWHIRRQGRLSYPSVFENYDKLIDKTIQLGHELNLNSALEFSVLYTYLLLNGYFSNKEEPQSNRHSSNIMLSSSAFEIMNGTDSALSRSEMLKDLLTKSKFDAAALTVFLKEEFKRDYVPPIEQQPKTTDSSCSIKILDKIFRFIFGNKVKYSLVLIRENGELFIYDPTAMGLLQFASPTKVVSMTGQGECTLSHQENYRFANSLSEKELVTSLWKQENFDSPYSRDDFISICEKNVELFRQNTHLLEDYYADTKQNIEQIVEGTKDITYFDQLKDLGPNNVRLRKR